MRTTLLLPLAMLAGCSQLPVEVRAYAVCGPEGTVDWDDNAASPPPHCNRNGWDGHNYRGDE